MTRGNPCLNCSCEGCHKRNEIETDSCPLDPTEKQLEVIRNSRYSTRNVDTMKEASDVVESILGVDR